MAFSPESREAPKPREIIFDRYGTYLVTSQDAYPLTNKRNKAIENPRNVVLVSQPDWETTLDILANGIFGDTTVLTPELITIAGKSFEDTSEQRANVEESLKKVLYISELQPRTTFVIGSPHFVDDQKLPFNAAIVFKEGEVKQVSQKRLLFGEERNEFNLDPDELPSAIGDATLLVCRDLIGAQKTRLIKGENGVENYVRRATNDSLLAQRFKNAEFVVPGSKIILVVACWGVGIPEGIMVKSSSQKGIDDLYLFYLRNVNQALIMNDPNIDQIIICDRAPINSKGSIVASRPMSGVFFRL